MPYSSGLSTWRTSYEINPIIFVGGVVGLPGAMAPITSFLTTGTTGVNPVVISNAISNTIGVQGPSPTQISLDDYFAHFFVLPGAQLIVNQFAHYPFLNQTVAANAIITQPLKVALRMIAPVSGNNSDYSTKLSVMTSLKSTLDQHITLGGTFNVATPSYIYTNCLLESLEDISNQGETEQLQFEWQWNFEQPLLTLQQAANAQNSLMNKISSQTTTTGDPPSPPTATTVGVPNPTIATAVVPTNAPAVAANVSPIAPSEPSSPLQSIILEIRSPGP